MFRQQHPKTISQHIPTAYDGRGLGRDDPVWPCYVAEAAKWDAALVDGWNKYAASLFHTIKANSLTQGDGRNIACVSLETPSECVFEQRQFDFNSWYG